jgi:CheY-like chemotaxis protein
MPMIHRLMLIDDDEDDREIFISIVQAALPGISLFIATNGQEGLEALQNAIIQPDLIFLDLNMPLMNGQQFMEAIKSDSVLQQIPVVILSTSSDKATIHDMKALGAIHFITKPDKYSAWEKMLNDFFINEPLDKVWK